MRRKGNRYRSGRQGRESCGVEVPVPSIARFGGLAYPMHASVTAYVLLGRKSHGRPGDNVFRGGNDLNGEQTWRPEHNEMAAVAKVPSTQKSFGWVDAEEPTCDSAGKADVVGEVTGMSTSQTAVIGARASKERHAEITSGRAISQQGLVATCKDPLTKAKAGGGGRDLVCRMRSYERRRRGNAL